MPQLTHPPAGIAPALEARVGLWIGRFAAALALTGGVLLIVLVILSVISITGRGMAGWIDFLPFRPGPIPGDFELVSAGCAVAVCTFLPWCQLRRGHVTVDVFITRLPPRGRAVLTLVGNVLMTGAVAIIAWRLQLGLADKMRYGETTMILQMPVWYGYAGAVVGLWAFALTALYTVWRSINEIAQGRDGD
jgi:hypothetical protein